MSMRKSGGVCLLAAMLAAMLTGCGSGGNEAAGAGSAAGKAAREATEPEAARLAANMVKAVSSGEGQAAVDVKFELSQRPQVGKPVDISIAFVPVKRLERFYARFQGGEDLELVKGGETDQIARPVAAAPIMHTVTVIPKRDGIFTLSVVVLMDSETDSVSRNYLIPLIAGSGLPEWAPKQAVAAHTAPYVNAPESPPAR